MAAPPQYTAYRDGLENDYMVLDALRLIRFVDTGYFPLTKYWTVKILFYHVTSLGFEFAQACGVPQQEASAPRAR